MRRSWIIEKYSDDYQSYFKMIPVEGEGYGGPVDRVFLRHKTSYFVAYEGHDVPNSLCECQGKRIRHKNLTRLSHVYNWGDVPWIEFITWGA